MLYILHLSDIHFGKPANSATRRLPQLVKAATSRIAKSSDVLIALTGDIAQAGKALEYEEGLEFFGKLKDALLDRECTVFVAATPGNHDCDLDLNTELRASLLEKHSLTPGPGTAEILAQPQAPFRAFLKDLTAVDQVGNPSRTTFSFTGKASGRIFVQALNTALYTTLTQQPGSLLIPLETVTVAEPDADLHVTLAHHPTGWLSQIQANKVREQLQSSTDLILTGHEHFGFSTASEDLESDANHIHIEGLALQGDEPDDSGFFLLQVDVASRRFCSTRFTWAGGRYEPTSEPAFRPFQCNRQRSRGYSFSPEHHAFLQDLGVALNRPDDNGLLQLDDIFVYPDAQEQMPDGSRQRSLKGEDLAGTVSSENVTVVTGPERGGKTCLAKQLIRDLATAGKYPLLIDGRASTSSTFDVRHLKKLYGAQYSFPDSEEIIQADSSKKIAILDDAFLREPAALESALEALRAQFDHVAVLTSDAFFQIVSTISPASVLAAAKTFRLLPFGHVRRGQLVDRWLSVSPRSGGQSTAAYAREHLQRMQTLTTVVGRNLVPAFPVVLVSLLRANDQNQQPNLSQSSFSYYYDLLIRQQLSLGQARPQEIDLKNSFLSSLAFHLLSEGAASISEQALRRFTEHFEKSQILQIDYVSVVASLERSKLFARDSSGHLTFRYSWARYYFAARRIADMLGMDATAAGAKDAIDRLIKDVGSEESGNILLFLAYFSKHQYLFDKLRSVADEMFKGEPELPVAYDNSLHQDAELKEAVRQLATHFAADSATLRAGWATQNDNIDGDRRSELEAEFQRANRISIDFFASVRVVQLLGQLLKNNPATMPGDQKLLVALSCYRLAFRALGFHARLVKENQEALIEAFVAPLVAEGHVPPTTKIEDAAKKSLHYLRFLATQSTVRRVANALSDFSLVPLAEKLATDVDTDGGLLVAAAVRLGQLEPDFPKDHVLEAYEKLNTNPLGQAVLRRLVATRLYLYDAGHVERQRICALLDINVAALPMPKRPD